MILRYRTHGSFRGSRSPSHWVPPTHTPDRLALVCITIDTHRNNTDLTITTSRSPSHKDGDEREIQAARKAFSRASKKRTKARVRIGIELSTSHTKRLSESSVSLCLSSSRLSIASDLNANFIAHLLAHLVFDVCRVLMAIMTDN